MKKILSTLFILFLLFSCSKKTVKDLNPGDQLYGFKLIQREYIKEHESDVFVFEHIKTGAKLVNMSNNDINRVFQITFNTYPKDSTGLAHILEHALLAGSKKFPSRTTFEELKKGSFSTYLNAFTSADSTSYPIATTNEKELGNMMHVYLDAVFNPNIYTNENIIKQEGVRIHYNDKTNKFEYKGVVFNEMKGVEGNPLTKYRNATKKALFPNSTYTYVSGGDTQVIPELKTQALLDFHTKYYHPSNSYSIIYGKGDVAAHLKYINDEYFSKYEKKDIKRENIGTKTITKPTYVRTNYSINKGESKNGKYYLGLNFITGSNTDKDDSSGLEFLADLLTRSSSSPLSKALIEAGVGNNIYSYSTSYLPARLFVIGVQKTDAYKRDLFEKTVFKTLKELSVKGFDKDYVESLIRSYEFQVREFDTGYSPKGIVLARGITEAFKRNLDVIEELKMIDPLEKLKKDIAKKDYFQNLIKKYLLTNQKFLSQEHAPLEGLAKQEEYKLNKKLTNFISSLSKKEIEKLKEDTKQFAKYQKTPPSPKDVAKIPFLKISDIKSKPEMIPQEKFEVDGIKVLYHPLETKGITYFTFNYDMKVLPKELVPYANFIVSLLENLRTEKYSLQELLTEKNMYTGYAYNSTPVFFDIKDKDKYSPLFRYTVGTLNENFKSSLAFINEVVQNTKYDDYDSLRPFLSKVYGMTESSIVNNPLQFARMEQSARLSNAGRYDKLLSGIDYFWFIKDLNENFEVKKEEITSNLQKTAKLLFSKDRLLISITASSEQREQIKKDIAEFAKTIPSNNAPDAKIEFKELPKRVALIVPGKVNYVAYGGFLPGNEKFSGELETLARVVGNDFLHPIIRQKFGAYGAYASAGLNNSVMFSSYRDPNLQNTLKTIKGVDKFVSDIKLTEDELNKYIIGTVKIFETPKSNKQKGNAMMNRYYMNYTLDHREVLKNQIIDTTVEKMKAYSKHLKAIVGQENYSVAGPKDKIMENKDKFDEIIDVLK